MVLWKFAFRHILGRPGRATLTLLSVVIAVAAVTSVTIATRTTRVAYKQMFATVSGRASLEVTAAGSSSFDARVIDQVVGVPGVEAASPVISRPTKLYTPAHRTVELTAVGIDPELDLAVRDYTLAKGQGRFLEVGDEGVLLEESFARNLGVGVGDEIKLASPRQRPFIQPVTIVGLLSSEGAAALRLGGSVFMSLAEAQYLFAGEGEIDSIAVVLDDSADVDRVREDLEKRLPAGLTVRRPATRSGFMEEILNSSEQGLHLASGFSLLLATFIILNTSMMNVGERRRQLSIMRAVGATRMQIRGLLYGESIVLGTVGIALGMLAGWAGAGVLTGALESILMATMPPIQVSVWPFVLAAVCGLVVSLVGVAVPARRAARLTPLEGMTHVAPSDIEGVSRKSLIAGALMSTVSGGLLAASIVGWLPSDTAIVFAMFLLVGIILLTPILLGPISGVMAWLIAPFLGVETRLAHRQVLRHRGRSTLTVGVLFLASATGIGMAAAVLDNVHDVKEWYRQTVRGDFFIRAMMPNLAQGEAAALPPELGEAIRAIPGVNKNNIDRGRMVKAQVAVEIKGEVQDQSVVIIVRDFTRDDAGYFDLEQGDPQAIVDKLFEGEVVVGSVLAQRAGLEVGDMLTMDTLEGPKPLRIAGVTNEYLFGGLIIFMERSLAKQLLRVGDTADVYLLQVAPDRRAEVKKALQPICDKYGAMLLSFAEVRSIIDNMVLGIQGCLWGILVLGFVVASFGVVNTLTMNVLEQTRELGLLRIVAMTRWQVRKTIFTQALLLAAIGVVPGVAAGVGVSYLIHLATLKAIGHPVPFGWHPLLLIGTFAGALALVLLAALIPAERAARLALHEALQYE